MPTLSMKDGSEKLLDSFTIRIIDAITLCHIVDEFEEFTQNLAKFSKGMLGEYNLRQLYNYIMNVDAFVKRDTKAFYVDNYRVLDAIHKYSYISNFLLIYFDRKTGKFCPEIMQMYEYIKNNKEDKDKILAVLNKLSELGFEHINFAENKKFDGIYEQDKSGLSHCYFLDGDLEVIPSVENIKYKSKEANYKIRLDAIPEIGSEITLNNLVFDVKCLPNTVRYDDTFKKILELKEEKEESYKVLSDIVRLDYNLESIIPALEKIDEIIANIHNCKYNDSAKKHIGKAKEAVYGLRTCLTNYQTDMVNQNLITEEILYKETKNVKRKSNNYIIIK